MKSFYYLVFFILLLASFDASSHGLYPNTNGHESSHTNRVLLKKDSVQQEVSCEEMCCLEDDCQCGCVMTSFAETTSFKIPPLLRLTSALVITFKPFIYSESQNSHFRPPILI